jgi:hypothetical protein
VLKLAAKRLANDKTGRGKAASRALAQNMEVKSLTWTSLPL